VKIAVLAGGVGGARFVRALTEVVKPRDVTVIANVGDDLEVLGLHVSPDVDTLLYTLGGLNDDERGWGRAGETWNALETVETLGEPAWFKLGDRDIGLHLVRTEALRRGEPLSAVTAGLAQSLDVGPRLLPATDDRLRTRMETPNGSFEFQEWFVARAHADPVDAVRYDGAETARPAPGVLEAIAESDLIAFAPSNPFVSIAPILAIPRIRVAVEVAAAPVVAVSPLIDGRAVKGPAGLMLTRLMGGTSAADVARCYNGLLDALAFDEADAGDAAAVEALGIEPLVTRTLLDDADARRGLVHALLELAAALP
jgi:LPPG:FO 2-phospho-L-lactate transferase